MNFNIKTGVKKENSKLPQTTDDLGLVQILQRLKINEIPQNTFKAHTRN